MTDRIMFRAEAGEYGIDIRTVSAVPGQGWSDAGEPDDGDLPF